jgi:4-amino-4-deoxy-L-arabinose transferase-like glycosyltransferase
LLVMTVPRNGWIAAAALCLLWCVLGLTGHEPWKPDEAYSFGLVLHVLNTGDWIVPTLAGEPFMEKPPVFFVTAALFAKVFGGLLPLHDAARLATGFYLALTLLCIGLSARELGDRKNSYEAPLIFIACIGLFELSHRLQTDISLMAGVAIALYGQALAPRRAYLGGLLLGSGSGLAFLSKGLIGPGLIGVSTLGLLALPQWRNPNALKACAWAVAAALPWLLIWPWLLYDLSPQQFHVWLWDNNISRFVETGSSGLGPKSEAWFYSKTLPWFAWPALPLGIWALWKYWRGARLSDSRLLLPLTTFALMLTGLAVAHDARGNYALPLLVPVALLGSLGAAELGARGRAIWYWSGVTLFGLLAIFTWILWILMWQDAPLALVQKLHQAEPGFVEQFRPLAMSVAVLLSIGWAYLVLKMRRETPAWSWAAGSTLAWGLFSTLALPAVDYGRSYKSVMQDLAPQLRGDGCISSNGLGEPERALLQYYAGVVTERVEIRPQTHCPLLLIQQHPEHQLVDPQILLPQQTWRLIWSGSRPGDDKETYELYRSANLSP